MPNARAALVGVVEDLLAVLLAVAGVVERRVGRELARVERRRRGDDLERRARRVEARRRAVQERRRRRALGAGARLRLVEVALDQVRVVASATTPCTSTRPVAARCATTAPQRVAERGCARPAAPSGSSVRCDVVALDRRRPSACPACVSRTVDRFVFDAGQVVVQRLLEPGAGARPASSSRRRARTSPPCRVAAEVERLAVDPLASRFAREHRPVRGVDPPALDR